MSPDRATAVVAGCQYQHESISIAAGCNSHGPWFMLTLAVGPICPSRWIALIVGVVVSLSFGWSMAAARLVKNDTLSVPPFFAVPSLETTPVEMEMQGIRWRVPRNFLESAGFSDRSDDPARRLKSLNLRIVTTLSTLHGATAETLSCYKALRVEVCPDTIIMLTQWGEVSSGIWNGPAIAEAARDPRHDLFGLTKVNTKMGLGPGEVYVFYGGSPEASIVIQCIARDHALLQDCTIRYDADGVPMRYSFSKRQLRHWRRIHDGVVAIIKSFNVGEAR